ncbi:MAG: Trx-linked arsenate reductase [Candidatus Nomurabacteria bacterium GW2011_GWB1_37_5]|uniref:Trx-linked arsenate reductase n=1 Tax=Candidatus Nomurabacteria bacterium GW2011_GWB1_37_5 TaxID=1618742 RepID=A0A0G0GZG0_9BACT|nr:MAG: Trx-linked arsenate reductase [Candidatus Nomurabacteria bacterium GW2011_GWB1_37_5]
MNILFVCKWNRFRSKATEATFKHFNRNPENQAQSAGLFPGVPVSDDIVKAGELLGLRIDRTQQGMPHSLLMWAGKIIIVADDIPPEIFKEIKENDKKDIIIWKIKDVVGTDIDSRKKVIGDISQKVKKLILNLNNKK